MKGLLPAELRQELEDTIASLKAQVAALFCCLHSYTLVYPFDANRGTILMLCAHMKKFASASRQKKYKNTRRIKYFHIGIAPLPNVRKEMIFLCYERNRPPQTSSKCEIDR